MNGPLGLSNPLKPVDANCASAPLWRRNFTSCMSVSDSPLAVKLSTKDLLALASMKNVAKHEM